MAPFSHKGKREKSRQRKLRAQKGKRDLLPHIVDVYFGCSFSAAELMQ